MILYSTGVLNYLHKSLDLPNSSYQANTEFGLAASSKGVHVFSLGSVITL